MRTNYLKTILNGAVALACILLLGAVATFGQTTVNLTAGASTITTPDGNLVPMWGYTCGTVNASCAPLNTSSTGWAPVVITVPTGNDLIINLTNNLTVPTSLVIVGQLGGGLGTPGGTTTSPDHNNPADPGVYPSQYQTWPIVDSTNLGTAPSQGARVQSFGTQVAPGATTPGLCWGACSTVGHPVLKPGTYLLESGSHPSIQGPMGLYGIVVVTTAPVGTTAGTAYGTTGTPTAVSYNAEIPLLLSEIDPLQNSAVATAVATPGFTETMVWSGLPGGCGDPSSLYYQQCYPPAVNYKPLYYLINGLPFSRSNATASLFHAAPATVAAGGTVLVRMVNAGLRMHVPSIVGSQTGTAVAPALPPAGFSLIAEDGNPLPGVSRVQSEVFMAAGKTYDVMINVPAAGSTALPIFDRELSLSANATARDAGMLAYISINGSTEQTGVSGVGVAIAVNDLYPARISGQTFTVPDPIKGVIANDTNVYGVTLLSPPTHGTLTNFNRDGTFTYVADSSAGTDTFTYCANGSVTGTTCSSGLVATVTLNPASVEAASGITMNNITYASTVATTISIKPPGILSVDKDAAGYALTVNGATDTTPLAVTLTGGGTAAVDKNGGFTATVGGPGTYTFTYKAQNSQGTVSSASATVTITFPTPTNLQVSVVDGVTKAAISDYRWLIEEDRTFFVDPGCTTNPPPTTSPATGKPCPAPNTIVPTFGTNFHTSYMPLVADGCTGQLSCEALQTVYDPTSGTHVNAVCDIGNGVCRADLAGNGQTPLLPSQVALDPNKRYYLTVFPGDAANSFENTSDCLTAAVFCGHGMGGAPVQFPATNASVTVLVQRNPFPPSKLSVFVFEDDFPLNGEQDGGGGVDVLSPNEPGLGGFNVILFDDAGGTGDATGQMTYDMFNQPLSNALSGTIDPGTKLDACPVSKNALVGIDTNTGNFNAASPTGITGTIVTCPKFESDGKTLSPLAGQAVVANLMPGRYGVVATPGADRIARGEEWLQTNTLDGQKAHDSFLRIGEPSFFQEYGPAGYHVSIGFANPDIINGRKPALCAGTDPNSPAFPAPYTCTATVQGRVTTERMSRTPDERLFSSGSNDSFAFTQCYVSLGDADGEDFAFTKCAGDGSFKLTGIPNGDWRITVFDQWNDMLVDGLSTPVRLAAGTTFDMGDIAMNQWQANIYTTTFFDANRNGVRDPGESGLALVATNNRFRDGSFSNFNNTDLDGNAGFNEIFPLFSWYVIETDSTRYKNTGTHVVYDAGGPADGACPSGSGAPLCGNSAIAQFYANTAEIVSVPLAERVPGAVYCATADCTGRSIGGSSDPPSVCTINPTTGNTTCSTRLSTGRIDPPWVVAEGWQGFSGQNNFIEFGKRPYGAGENGGIRGHVIYASTRPFDDPQLLLQTSWEPLVPGVTINLYKEGTDAAGASTLTLVDTTKTSSWDDWAQGFRSDGVPNMNCPGQLGAPTTSVGGDLFFFSLFNQPQWLDFYQNGSGARTLPGNSQYKCYDGMHNWNQIQPAPYDGMYQFPSVTARNPQSGAATATNCTACVTSPVDGTYMLPVGKYVVEVIVPPGYELVKEEDKNILIGDNYIAPITQQFGGLGNVFILPDQAEIAALFNANNPQNATQTLGATPRHEGDTGSVESFWPCVGASRIVPDFISLFPQSGEVSPFAGAKRNLCDRKEVILEDQSSVLAKFYLFTSTHVAAHFTGVITDDYTSEFDPFSPQFGEKFSPPDLPISIKDWTGTEISRVYADHWGSYNGLTYSTWEVNPPNPTGYAPTMMVTCMNDPGTGQTPDPLFNPQYSQFCYEIPFMPGQTQYMDTPVVPTSAFAGAGYNNPDCNYPDLTPAIKEVDGDGVGPWVSLAGHTLTITSLGTVTVPNNGYSGPAASTAPFNAKTITRNYGFGTAQGTGSVTIGGRLATVTGWGDTQITVTVPTGIPACNIQQQVQYSGGATMTQCGQLIVTRGDNHKQSVDTVTVTVGGKAPTHVAASDSIQTAIDHANPGDLLIVDPTCTNAANLPIGCAVVGVTAHSQSSHNEILIMWKPVRLQGVGAASSILNANTHPAGKLDVWRRQVDCLFGLGLNGYPASPPATGVNANPYDPSKQYSCPGTGWVGYHATANNPQVDRLPLEATVGWDANLNGNLAELLQEPSLMGALEGAAITVLSKGVFFPSTPWDPTLLAGFPTGTLLLNNSTSTVNGCGPNTSTAHNPFPSSFWCNPSRIDGLGITDSSQGGGGIFIHGWGHNIQIANNRVYNNAGTLSGGINVGQGEFPGAYLGGIGAANAAPGSCQSSIVPNLQLPYCFEMNVNVHHNYITQNASTGDELFSATPAGAGGVTFCTGADYYLFQYNWLCGNLSSGDGGGLGHMGFIYHGDIEHNTVLFNQSTNPTIATNGGGILIMGAPDVDPTCGATTDQDCVPPVGSIGPSDGTGPGLVINANLIMGNAAESGSGGGLRLQQVNGSDVVNFPLGTLECLTIPLCAWNSVTVTNNIIANNVAGWDGAGVSLQDALVVNFVNNTVISNDTTASSGMLFDTIGAPLASSGGVNCHNGTPPTQTSCPQPAGFVVVPNSPVLVSNLPATFSCPLGHGSTGAQCRLYSVPILYNDLFWQNRSFYIGVGNIGVGTLNQQHVVALYNAFTSSPVASEPTTDATTPNGGGVIVTGGTGACVSGVSYWDLGVRGDTGPTNHTGSGGITLLSPEASFITSTAGGYTGGGLGLRVNSAANPTVLSQYCNGSRTPPEFKSSGYQVPPGIADATVPNPLFNLTPSATVDEGNNWININWGPLTLNNTTVVGTDGNYAGGPALGNYGLPGNSPAVDYVTSANSGLTYAAAPTTDFFGTARPQGAGIDVGAVEFVSTTTTPAPALTSIIPTSGARGTAVAVTLTGTNLTGTTGVNVSCTIALLCTNGITVSNVAVVNATTVTATFTIAPNASIGLLAGRNVSVTAPGGTSGNVTFTVVNPPAATLASIAPNSSTIAQRGTNVSVTLTGTNFTAGSTVAVGGTGNGGTGVSLVAGSVTVVNSTTITATFAITSLTTDLGAKNVRVTNASGTASNNVPFTKN
jgi:hypothetical protein